MKDYAFGFLFGMIAGFMMCMTTGKAHTNIIKHGHAHYDTVTGEFTWNKECNK